MGKNVKEEKPIRIFFRIDRGTGEMYDHVISSAEGVEGTPGYIPAVVEKRQRMLTDLEAMDIALKKANKEGYDKISMQQAFDEYFEFMAYNN